ncbi:hypothetical protein [Lysobacter solisilvae (ex Woo and Kim 2022)]|uniref:hypothetical protein n=1 Tax=Agrilutibacter terrestris TaxID=2865112 RepID=UPI001F1EF501|nr:hypothetical protein [Lysobacter terrestris]
MLRDLLRAGIGRVHLREARGQPARRLAAAATGFPDPSIARHLRGDQVEQLIGVFRARCGVRIGNAGKVILEAHGRISKGHHEKQHRYYEPVIPANAGVQRLHLLQRKPKAGSRRSPG